MSALSFPIVASPVVEPPAAKAKLLFTNKNSGIK
jgi:hypothetical protein